jgi:ATP-binding cassette subfamily B protein
MIPVRAYFSLLNNYLKPLRPRVVLLSFVLFSTIALQLVNPQLIKRFIDGAIGGRDASALIPIAVTFMLIAVGQQALAIWATYLAEDIGWSATNHLRGDLTDHAIHLDMGFHKGHSAGELIERIDGDVTSLSNFFSAMMIKVVGNGGLVIGIIVMLWLESWIVGLSVSIFTALAIAAMAGFHRVAVPWWKAVRATAAEAYGFVGEVVEGTEDITSNGASPYMEARFNDIQQRWLPQTVRAWMGWATMWSSTIVLYGLSTSIVFILGSWLYGIGTLSIGAVYLVFHYVEMTRHPMEQIRAQMEDLQKAGAAIARVDELMTTTTKLKVEGSHAIGVGALSVEFDDVSFSYDDAGRVCMSRKPDRFVSTISPPGTLALPTSADESAWSLRTCSSSEPRFGTTSRSSTTASPRSRSWTRSIASNSTRGSRRCPMDSTPSSTRGMEGCRPAKPSFWRSPGSSWKTRALWCSTRRRPGSIRQQRR